MSRISIPSKHHHGHQKSKRPSLTRELLSQGPALSVMDLAKTASKATKIMQALNAPVNVYPPWWGHETMPKTATSGPTTKKPMNNPSKGGNSYTTSTQEAFQSPGSRRGENKENRVDFCYPLAKRTQHRTLSQALLESQDVIDPENTGGVWQFPKRMVDEIIQTDAVSIGVPTMKENHDSRTYAIQQISSPQRKTSKYRPHSPDEVKDEWRDKKTSEEGAFIWFPLDNNAAQDESPSSPPRVPRPFKSSHDEQRSPSRKSREDERSPSRSLSPQKNAPAHKRDIVKSAHQKPSEPPSLNLPILHEQQVNEPLEPGLVDICEAFLKSGFLGCLDLSVLDDE